MKPLELCWFRFLMAIFKFSAIDEAGKTQKGQLTAEGAKEAKKQLKNKQWHIVSLEKTKNKATKQGFKKQLSIVEISIFFRQLSSLISAAIPIDEALSTIRQNANNSKLKNIVGEIIDEIKQGQTLAYALKSSSHYFLDYHLETISAGEAGSNLVLVLDKLATDIEKQHQFSSKIKKALIYPVTVVVLSLLIVGFLLVAVVPEIAAVFSNNGQELPPLTVIVIGFSNFLSEYFKLIGIGILLMIIGFKLLIKKDKVKYFIDTVLAKLPIAGKLIANANAVRFSRTLSLLYASGTPIEQALKHSSMVVNFMPMKFAIQNATKRVNEGSDLYTSLSKYKALPQMFLYMLASGETTSRLSEMLDRACENQEYEIEYQVGKMINIFEPMMIVITGGMVLTIVLAILLPIFEINTIPL